MEQTLPVSRFEALQIGSQFFKTGRPCKYMHYGKRRTDSGACHECYQQSKVGALRARRGGADTVKLLSEAVIALRDAKGTRVLEQWAGAASAFAALMTSYADPTIVESALAAINTARSGGPVAQGLKDPPGKYMTSKANGAAYRDFVAAGWTDAQLREQGYMSAEST